MFIVICEYRAKTGEEDAIVALHEEWERALRHRVTGYLCGELLHGSHNGRHFMSISRYCSEAAYLVTNEDGEIQSWRRRLASLSEEQPILSCWHSLP